MSIHASVRHTARSGQPHTGESPSGRPPVAEKRKAAVRLAYGLCGAILVNAILVAPVLADNCAPADGVEARLYDEWGETRREGGFNGPNILAIYANDKTGTWTILVLTPEGEACLIADGDGWTDMSQPVGDPA